MTFSFTNYIDFIWYLSLIITIHVFFAKCMTYQISVKQKNTVWIRVLSPLILNLVAITFIYVFERNTLEILMFLLMIFSLNIVSKIGKV